MLTQAAVEQLSEEERRAWCAELGLRLSQRISGAADFETEIKTIISELRALGFDLWNFDQKQSWQAWCPDYTKPPSKGLLLEFQAPDSVEVEWEDRSKSL